MTLWALIYINLFLISISGVNPTDETICIIYLNPYALKHTDSSVKMLNIQKIEHELSKLIKIKDRSLSSKFNSILYILIKSAIKLIC